MFCMRIQIYFIFFVLVAASYIGVKEFVPPYLNSSLSTDELMSGVSFASAGSGYDPLTPALSVTYLFSIL